ncbi:hypothetical protein ACHEXK_08695 [Limnohabitans sp. DCL3]|uniref:hypothetical protein n=1 Tax=Limnohabitans sp. DCL3 TaxID=3374103 RepID=UPI003A8BB3F6
MKEFFQDMSMMAWSLVLVMIALTIIAAKWEQVKWWWLNTWYGFPFIGKIASLSRNTRKDDTYPTWFLSEKKLCQDYKKFQPLQSEHDFNEKVTYLTLAGDDGRTPMPLFIWVLTIALVIVEALGFSYVLAGYTLPGASENNQELAALGIAFLISVILVVLTHAAGRELYKSVKIRTARRQWNHWNESKERHLNNTFGTQPVNLSMPQSIDAKEPHFTRLANRVGTDQVNVMGIVAIIFVLIVAIGATYVRGQVLEKQLAQEITGQSNSQGFTIKLNQDGLNFSSDSGKQFVLPAGSQDANRKVEQANQEYQKTIDRQGGWGTFIVLAFVFVFLQIIGAYFGYQWGFAGRQSQKAYDGTGGFARYEDVYQKYEEISDVAQSKLADLQEKISYKNSTSGNAWVKSKLTYKEFLRVSREEAAKSRVEADQVSDALRTRERERHGTRQLEDLEKLVPKAIENEFELILVEIDALSDKDSKKNFIASLNDPIRTKVIDHFKNRKEEEKARIAKQQNEDLDNLF